MKNDERITKLNTAPSLTDESIDSMPLVDTAAFAAGEYAARCLMRQKGHPASVAWFMQNAPHPMDLEAIAATGKPAEFWTGMHVEINGVWGTA